MIVRYLHDGAVRIGTCANGTIHALPVDGLGELLALPLAEFQTAVEGAVVRSAVPDPDVRLLPPIDGLTEVWASGVTYRRSSDARQEESQTADVYERVYAAPRPELFFKSPAWRVVGDGEPIGIRTDSSIDVPEPELALVCNAHAEIVGLTISNDVSSRSIEGENPLYLPQAKIYSGACALGPGIVASWQIADAADLAIAVTVRRGGETVWSASTSTARMHRGFDELVEHLFRQASFPHGVVLSTGTGLVPDLDFTLQAADVVRIEVDGLGALTNPVHTASSFAWLTPRPDRSPTSSASPTTGTLRR